MENPYAPPTAESGEKPSTRLYSPGQVAWATFLGTPFAGCVLLAMNYRRCGDPVAAYRTWVSGLIGTALLLVISFFLPDNAPNSVIPVAYTYVMYQYAQSWQGKSYAQHLAAGGFKASAWAATGIGLLSAFCLVAVLGAIVFVLPAEWFGE